MNLCPQKKYLLQQHNLPQLSSDAHALPEKFVNFFVVILVSLEDGGGGKSVYKAVYK